MKKNRTLYMVALLALAAHCGNAKAQSVSILADGKQFPIEAQQTQTEMRAGWKIVDIQLKSKAQRYLWGTRAKQLADTPKPTFIVDTDSLVLSDMVLIKLNKRREYRKIPKAQIHDNKCIFVDLNTFIIEPYGEESFSIKPLQELEKGEYIFTWTSIKPIGELSDWMVWPFSVE